MNGVGPAPALRRLALSRERLRLALGGPAVPRRAQRENSRPGGGPDLSPPDAPAADAARASEPADGWLGGPLAMPLAQVLLDTVSGWWLRHPLRPVVVLAGAGLTVAIGPVAQRHPLGLLAGALFAGGLLAWSRPWRHLRWALRPALFAGLAQQLLSRALAEVPLESWLTAWTEMAKSPQPPASPPGHSSQPAVAPHAGVG